MSDKPSQEQPAGDPLGVAGSESDIDALLAGTAELAADLSEELGGTPRSASAPSPNLPEFLASPQPELTIDKELDQIDSLLDQACRELGADASHLPAEAEGPAALPRPPQGPSESAAYAQPPVASPEQQAADRSKHRKHTSGIGDTPELDGPGDFDSIPTFDDGSSAGPPEGPEANVASHWSAASHQSAAEGLPDAAELGRRRLAPVARALLGAIDLFDRPFGWVGYRARVVIGWLALLTLLAAAGVWVISSLE